MSDARMAGKQLTIKLEVRPDGGLRIYSEELPGLILSGSDPAKVLADVMPAWAVLATWPVLDAS